MQSLSLLVLITTLVQAYAHVCLISPPQRGSMVGLNKPGAPDCILLTAPCGGRAEEEPILSIRGGQNFTVTMQKNLDHFNKAKPGYFTISIGDKTDLKEVYRTPDTSEPSLSLVIANVTIPKRRGRAIVQVTYVTSNPKAPPVFYQCSDILIH